MDWMLAYEGFLSRLTAVEDHGNCRGRATCPCDERHDLWLAVGHDRQLFTRCCPRDTEDRPCTAAAVMARVGLDLRYLNPDWRENTMAGRNDKGKPKLEATHGYWDQDSTGKWYLSYEVLKRRYADGSKEMPQRRPNPDYDGSKPEGDGNPKHVYNLKGVRPVLFRMKELRESLAKTPDRWVFIQEGEVKVDIARTLNLLSTCCPMGALKWNQPYYKEELRGKNVVIVPDEDLADATSGLARGLEHAKQVARDLIGVAARVKIIRLPDPEYPGWGFENWRFRFGQAKPDDVRKALTELVNAAATITDPKQLDEFKPHPFPPAEVSPPPVPPSASQCEWP
jgi:hypothetical protein